MLESLLTLTASSDCFDLSLFVLAGIIFLEPFSAVDLADFFTLTGCDFFSGYSFDADLDSGLADACFSFFPSARMANFLG